MDETICNRCGNEYNWSNQEPPADASFYWEPKCPACGAKLTAPPRGETWLNILASDEPERDRLQAYARLYHGRLTDVGRDKLISLAQYFDERANVGGPRIGPAPARNIAFNLREQARRK